MVMDHYREKWEPVRDYFQTLPNTIIIGQTWPSPITAEEIAEFRKLLERAREYDAKNQEPDCELDEKRATLKQIAKQLGVDISFVDAPDASARAAQEAT
jgi:hypothetical protein